MATYSTRQHLIIPAGTDAADIATIVANWNKLDGTSGLILCTSSTRPTTNKFPGMYIKETDTLKHYYLDNSGTWLLDVYSGGTWIEDSYAITNIINLTGDGSVFYGASMNDMYRIGNTNGSTAPAVDIPNNTTIDLGIERGCIADGFTLAIATRLKIDFKAMSGGSIFYSSTGPKYYGGGYQEANNSGIRWELWDALPGTKVQDIGFTAPYSLSQSEPPKVKDILERDFYINAAAGTHQYYIKAVTVGATNGTAGYCTGLFYADLIVTLSAA